MRWARERKSKRGTKEGVETQAKIEITTEKTEKLLLQTLSELSRKRKKRSEAKILTKKRSSRTIRRSKKRKEGSFLGRVKSFSEAKVN